MDREKSKGHVLGYPIPEDSKAMQSLFAERLSGKYQPWFPQARWSIVQLTYEEFKTLMVIDAPETRREQLVVERIPRTLENAAENALASGYFKTMRRKREHHFWYYLSYIFGQLSLKNENRLVVRTLNETEKQDLPESTYSYYLHDGWGRALPYMVLVLKERIKYKPVEAFLAERC